MAEEGFDFEALDEENEMSAGIIGQDDIQLSGSARYVTVLSDFGETEQFVIEGESLIRWAFEDTRLDWNCGGQILHLIFIVENLFNKLVLRGAHFRIVFFESHREIWNSGSKLLARSLLISHLKRSLKPPAGIICLPSADSESWINFLQAYRPSFIGVSEGSDSGGPITRFSRNCHSSGISIVYLSQFEILDHSVRGFYVQSRREMDFKNFRTSEHANLTNEPKPKEQTLDFSSIRKESLPSHLVKDWRVLVCCHACSAWMRTCEEDRSLSNSSRQDAETVAKIFLLHIFLIRRNCFSIHERCLVQFSLPEMILDLIRKFNDFVGVIISSASREDEDLALTASDIIDFSDGRLQCAIADRILQLKSAGVKELSVDSDCGQEIEESWRCSSSQPCAQSSLFPLAFGSDFHGHARISKEDVDTKVRIVKNDLFATDCQFARKMIPNAEISSFTSSHLEVQVDKNQLEKLSWNFSEGLESFLWTHCKDQSATSEPSSRSTSEWERKRQLRWKARQSQMYFRYLHDYAASLAGTTVLGSTCISSAEDGVSAQHADDGSSIASEQSVDSKQSKGKQEKKKPEKKLSKKEQLLADIEAKKQKGASLKLESEWKDLKLAVKKSTSTIAKLKDLDDFANRCLSSNQMTLALEVTLQKLSESKSAWQEDRDSKNNNMKFAILTVENVRMMLSTFSELLKDTKLSVASEARNEIVETLAALGFVDPALHVSKSLLDPSDRENFTNLQEEAKELTKMVRNKLSVGSKSLAHFQLEHMGYLLPRPAPKVKDPRITTFTPDEWQRALLDVVDSRDSALVCAPTSSGKTFISYYCMEKVMRDPAFKDGVLVFVAPTKALINQIAAQVYGAYHAHFGIYTDAYRHRALTSRILVTVPDCLESLLLSPEHASWAQRIRYIILDEVHCISSSDGGSLWEHILLLSNAPFLALSATVGEPEAFVAWLQRIKDFQRDSEAGEKDQTFKVRLVQHFERWVDLRRHVFIGIGGRSAEDPAALVKSGRLHVRARVDHTSAEIDLAEALEPLHPLASFTSAQMDVGKVPVNVRFEPRDSLALFNALWSVRSKCHEAHDIKNRTDNLSALDPLQFFAGETIFISRPQSVQYEAAVKAEFETWISNGWRRECVQVLRILGNDVVDCENRKEEESGDDRSIDGSMVNRLFQLMCVLHRQDRLPAVIFNFDRAICENLAFGFNSILSKAEESARVEHAKTLAKSAKVEVQKEKVQKRIRDKVLSEKKEEAMLQEMAEMAETSSVETAGVDEVSFKAQFTFVQEGRSSKQDFDRITESARKIMGEGHPLIQILRRGIGVHHSGLQNKYRMAVEMLFRCGYLRIVLATETLAFGINMPCRTVVFAGDHVALNSIQYQQMSGRAGRRGLDVLGHVIFFEVPRHKMHRLIVAPVPRLYGHFLHSPTFLIRLFTLDHQVASQRGANPTMIERTRNAVNRALNHSLYDSDLKIPTSVRAVQIKHIFNQFLRSGLVDANLSPCGLINLASHFHAAEPSNLALAALLQDGALHRLCEKPEGRGWDFTKQPAMWRGNLSDWEATARDLLVVLSHLFCRERLHSSLAHEVSRTPRRGLVVLPELPDCCAEVLNRFHRSSLVSLSAAAAAVASESPAPAEMVLPYSNIIFPVKPADAGGRTSTCGMELAPGSVAICNPFACLSGNADVAETCHELLASAREDLALHDALLPLPALPGPPLSAYIIDFFNHEQLDVICRECGMCSAIAWQGLRQFQLILTSLHKAVAAYAPATDPLLACIGRLEAEYSAKFYAKLYR